jgi:phage host-nuclease inhibitor protein Gam
VGRPKKASRKLANKAECEVAMAELLIATVELEAAEGEQALAVATASAKYESRLDEAKSRAAECWVALQAYYMEHVTEIEAAGGKHLQLANGVMGRRDNPPAVVALNKAWSEEAILAAVESKLGGSYIRTVKQIDKDELKSLDAAKLKGVGLKLRSGEAFYADPARPPKTA